MSTQWFVLERDETEVGAEVDVERIHDTCGNFNHIIINPNRIIQYTLNAVSTLTSRCDKSGMRRKHGRKPRISLRSHHAGCRSRSVKLRPLARPGVAAGGVAPGAGAPRVHSSASGETV